MYIGYSRKPQTSHLRLNQDSNYDGLDVHLFDLTYSGGNLENSVNSFNLGGRHIILDTIAISFYCS